MLVGLVITGCQRTINNENAEYNVNSDNNIQDSGQGVDVAKPIDYKGCLREQKVRFEIFGGDKFYYCDYTSDTMDTFVAVKGYKNIVANDTFYVLMKDGKGTMGPMVHKRDYKEYDYDYGYLKGQVVNEDDFSITTTYRRGKYDADFGSSLHIMMDITTNNKQTGLLFFKMLINGKEYQVCRPTVVIKGEAKAFDVVITERDKIDVEQIKIVPLLFCKANELKNGEVSVEKAEFDCKDLSISQMVYLKTESKGVVLTQYTLKNKLRKTSYTANTYDLVDKSKAQLIAVDGDFLGADDKTFSGKEARNLELIKKTKQYYVPVYNYQIN